MHLYRCSLIFIRLSRIGCCGGTIWQTSNKRGFCLFFKTRCWRSLDKIMHILKLWYLRDKWLTSFKLGLTHICLWLWSHTYMSDRNSGLLMTCMWMLPYSEDCITVTSYFQSILLSTDVCANRGTLSLSEVMLP